VTNFSPEQLAEWTGGQWTRPPSAALQGFAIDTRQLRPGQVFVALKTKKRDGHAYLADAAKAGASAALVAHADAALTALPQLVVAERDGPGGPLGAFQAIAQKHREAFQAAGGKVIGITGSVGKTSTKNLLAALLGASSGQGDRVLATEGNLNNHLGVPLTLTRLDLARHRFAVIEAGIGAPGEMLPLAKMIEPDVAIVTAVAPAHLAALGDLEGVAREKAVLAAHVRAGSGDESGRGGGGGVAIFPDSLGESAAFRALRTQVLRSGNFDGLSGQFELPRLSVGMTQNARLAIRAALYLGVAPAQIQARLDAWAPAPLRGQWQTRPVLTGYESGGDDDGDATSAAASVGALVYLDCYNANPASMADALDAFYTHTPESLPRVFVLGGMEELGPSSAMFHRALGRSLRLRPQDRAYAIGDEAEALRTGALESGTCTPEQITVIETLDTLRPELTDFSGALFLKGSRRYQLETLLDPTGTPAGEAAPTALSAKSTDGATRPKALIKPETTTPNPPLQC